MPTVLFTGGGTAGHVTPNIALIEAARQRGWQVDYAGSRKGIEKALIEPLAVPYHPISSGKLRRYFSWENLLDPFRIVAGIIQAFLLLGRLRPDAVFSKGGFVSVPVVVAAWLRRIPVISHESDVTPGLANRLTFPFCRRICLTFDASRGHLPEKKVLVTGTPVRQSIVAGDAGAGRRFLGLGDDRPLLLVFGGSLGAAKINEQVRRVLDQLLESFQVAHIVGRGNVEAGLNRPGYVQKEFVGDEFGDVLSAAEIVISRAGANSLYELFLTRKPHLLIPLGRGASRGDQLVNAETFEREGMSRVLPEDGLDNARFLQALADLQKDSDSLRQRLEQFQIRDSISLILGEIERAWSSTR